MAIISNGADVFAAIAAPARREMLNQLALREMPVLELAESFEMSLSAVSQHLGILRDAGLVTVRKDGRQRFYRVSPEPLKEVSEWVAKYERFWVDRLAALGEYLDKEENK